MSPNSQAPIVNAPPAQGDGNPFGSRPANPLQDLVGEEFDDGESVAPEGNHRSRTARHGMVRFLNFLFTCIILAMIGAMVVLYWGKSEFDAPGPLKRATTMVVPAGAGLSQIARMLETRGIIPQQSVANVFKNGVRASSEQGNLQAGEFAFTPGMSMRQVMKVLTDGKAIQYAITFPEGWTSYQIMQRLAEDKNLTGNLPALPAEGDLLPSTYQYLRNGTRAEIVKQMLAAQKKAVVEIWAKRAEGLPIKTPEEMVILASIVEKETGQADERPHVASVFVNRLNRGMKLQSDPTIIYGIYGGRGKPRGTPIYRSQILKPTPFNTYVIDALPPTPIANPGRASLEAVANPLVTNDLFFVADGTGGHAFASTNAQHEENVARWRVIERQRKKEAELKAAVQKIVTPPADDATPPAASGIRGTADPEGN